MFSENEDRLSGVCDEYQSLCRAIGSGGVYKRILECRQMAENINSLFPSDLPDDAQKLLDHLAFLDGWLLHLADKLPPEDHCRNTMVGEVQSGDRKSIYRNNYWVAC